MDMAVEEVRKISGNLKIPPCPALLQEVMKTARQPNADMERIAASVKRDAAMTAALLQLANSPLHGVRCQLTSVTQAISFLGVKTTLNLLNHVALRQSMGDDSGQFTKFWERSSQSAAVAAKLARRIPGMSQDDAYAVTLFHDSGIPVLMQHYPTYRETVMANTHQGRDIQKVENAHFSTTHAIVGNLLANSWRLPKHICQAILYHHDTTVFDSISEEISRLIGIVHMAEVIVDEYLCRESPEWARFENAVLACLGLAEEEFREMKDDMLGFLNGE
jgi:HD-like signal output (HDOD) protein